MLPELLRRADDVRAGAAVLLRAGAVPAHSPLTYARVAATLLAYGTGPAGGFVALAQRWGDRVGVVDERGSSTWAALHRRSDALALALRERGVGEGDAVAVMCRNHRGFVETVVAVGKLGADVLLLNTAFAGPQLVEVLERERPVVVVHDEEFTGLLSEARGGTRVLAWVDDGVPTGDVATLEDLVAAGGAGRLRAPRRRGRTVILTSGTTGTPKGAARTGAGLDAAVSLLSRMPLRQGWRTHVAAPLFHTWGFAHLALAMLLGSTVVLRRRFDPEACLRTVAEEGCESLVVIPVMLQRMLALDADTLADVDLSRLQVVAASGSALPGDLATRWRERFGETLYNIYGSTEVAWVSIATPEDLREAPGSAGRPPRGTVVRILGEDDREVPRGSSGRVFVGNSMLFEGYTGGGGKPIVDSLMASGDVGRVDEQGRLFVEGRDDDMIVSGGENVFPQEVEDALATHPDVVEAACLGVKDEDFGQRLRAFVVLRDDSATPAEEAGAVLQEWVRQHLARYKVPREVVLLDELPRNATGKVRKLDLAPGEDPTPQEDT